MIIQSSTGFGYVTSDGKIIQKLQCPVDVDVIAKDGVWTDVADSNELSDINITSYNEDDLIEWAYANVFTQELIPHLAAFLSFARKGTQKSADIFRAYATAMGLDTVAETIIAKAIELGANIEEVS